MRTCKDCIHEGVCWKQQELLDEREFGEEQECCEEASRFVVDYLIKCGVTVQNEWIPVSEPPKENGIYCVMVENHKSRKYKKRTHARYKNGRWLDLYDDWENRCWHVTHWFPLPEAPKMKGGEQK